MEMSLAKGLLDLKSRFDELLAAHGLPGGAGSGLFAQFEESTGAIAATEATTVPVDRTKQPDLAQIAVAPEPGAAISQPSQRRTRPSLPNPRLIRRIIRGRQTRGRHFRAELFADPAWDMLLDLSAAESEHGRVSVSSLCIASNVPASTALRWIDVLENYGLVERHRDRQDARRSFVALSTAGITALAAYFQELGSLADFLV